LGRSDSKDKRSKSSKGLGGKKTRGQTSSGEEKSRGYSP